MRGETRRLLLLTLLLIPLLIPLLLILALLLLLLTDLAFLEPELLSNAKSLQCGHVELTGRFKVFLLLELTDRGSRFRSPLAVNLDLVVFLL